MRERPGISEQRLLACLQDHYDLIPVTLKYLPLGLDFRAGVYRVESEQGTSYLLKATSRPFYELSCLVPRYLRDQGIISVVAPFPTRNNELWVRLDDWTVIIYPFIDGDTSWTGMTDEQWKDVGATFKQIHQIPLPPKHFKSIRKETFDSTEYAGQIHAFEAQHLHAQDRNDAPECSIRSDWLAHQSTIHKALATLEKLAKALQKRNPPSVICHADLHPANLLREDAGHVFVIDWDEVMLAPKERDFIFVRVSPDDSEELPGTPAFFQGYGETEIDWIALTYYRYERVIQDLIECVRDVFLRDDLGEGTRAEAAQLFHAVLLSNISTFDAAQRAAAHLPPDLVVF